MRKISEKLNEQGNSAAQDDLTISCMSAVALATHDMRTAVQFYRSLGFALTFGGETASFSTLRAGTSHLNLIEQPKDKHWSWWGRVIFHVSDVEAMFARAVSNGLSVESEPRTADWGEIYFHITDPDGHQLSFAKPVP